jgi:demethylmenaquinone methyltransferase/2-methoxy-6-polyprenyl-1,4-benzoquinol methylase
MPFTIPEGNSKADYVKRKFSSIAGKYDLFNDLVTQGMHRGWKHSDSLRQKTVIKKIKP